MLQIQIKYNYKYVFVFDPIPGKKGKRCAVQSVLRFVPGDYLFRVVMAQESPFPPVHATYYST